MSRVLTNEQNYYNIADTIRQMKNVNTTYKPREMASALKDIYSNEVEGILPLSFEANGNNLLDYRIDGASGGVGERTKNLCPYNKVNNSIIAHVESGKTYSFSLFASFLIGFNLMKRNASSQSTSSVATKYNSEGNVSVTFTADEDFDLFVNGFSLISGKTFLESVSNFQLEESSTVTDYEPYGYKVPVMVEGKNLLYGTIEQGGFNAAGLNGNISSRVRSVEYTPVESSKTYTLSLNVDNNKNVKIGVSYYDTNDYTTSRISSSGWISNPNNKFIFTIPNNIVYIRFIVAYNDDSNIYPSDLSNIQIEEGNTATDYEPYHEPTTTNIYLDEPIYENESISLSDTNVNIPTIRGTNVLTVDTTVQPSNVYVQAPKDSDEIIEIINTLEAI